MNPDTTEQQFDTALSFNGVAQATPTPNGTRTAEEHGHQREYDLFYYMGHDTLNGVDGVLTKLMRATGAVELAVETGSSDRKVPDGTTAVIRAYYDTIHFIDRYHGVSP